MSVKHSEERIEHLTYTVEQVGRLLGIGRCLAYRAATRGELPTVRIGRRLLVPKTALNRWLASAEARLAAAQAQVEGADDRGLHRTRPARPQERKRLDGAVSRT